MARNSWILKWDTDTLCWVGQTPNIETRIKACHEGINSLGDIGILHHKRANKRVVLKVTKKRHDRSVLVWIQAYTQGVWHTMEREDRYEPDCLLLESMERWAFEHFPEIEDQKVHKYYVSAKLLD